MRRDLAALTSRTFDLLVVGGGIYGAIAAWDATLRGLGVAIVDRADFGGGTSFNSAKTLHGGVRALQSGNVAALRRFVRERRALCRVAPHLVRPLPFVVPTYRGISRNRTLLRLYFALHDLLARDRNDGLAASRRLPASRLLSRNECLDLNPLIDPQGVTGGIEWFDYQMHNSDRVHFSFIASAVEGGAVAANYVEATAGITRKDTVEGIRASDRLTGESLEIRARVVLNAAGPWAPELGRRLAPGARARLGERLSKAMNFVIASPLRGSHAVAGPADGRFLFIAPWREFAIVGTSYDRYDGRANGLALDRHEIEAFMDAVNRAFPGLSLESATCAWFIEACCRYRRTAAACGGGRPARSWTMATTDSAGSSACWACATRRPGTRPNAPSISLSDSCSAPPPPAEPRTPPLIGGDMADAEDFIRETTSTAGGRIPTATQRRLACTYGTRHRRVLAMLTRSEADRAPLGSTCDVTAGEVRYAVREEMAVKLSDALLRRTEAGSAEYPGQDAVASAAGIMAEELDWTPDRIETETADLRRAYRLPG